MATTYQSGIHTFSIDDILGTFGGVLYPENPAIIDTDGSVVPQITDKDGNVLSAIDSEFGFYVTDFIGAEPKVLDGDYQEGFAGNIYDPADPSQILGISIKNAETDVFRSGLPLGTWSLGVGGAIVKASTEHYTTMVDVLSDQAFPNDPDAIRPLDNDLRLLDRYPTGPGGAMEDGPLHNFYVDELVTALQIAIDNNEIGANPQVITSIDFDRDGTADTFSTESVSIDYDTDGDGTPETIQVGALDIGNDGTIDVTDSWLNGIGGTADLTDLLEPNESTVTNNIAYGDDYSVTLKDDGKLLYRWGTAVKRPNDVRMEAKLDLPAEWTADDDNNGVADALEGKHQGFLVTSARLVIHHDVTNNPNDQIRPEDWENEAAIGRLPSYYVVQDPDDASNTLWVSIRDSYNGEGDALPSYLKLTDSGEVDRTAGGTAVYDPIGRLVGYRNEDGSGNPIGTVFRDGNLADQNDAAGLDFTSSDLSGGFTAAWYTTVDREPFEWSYDKLPNNPYKQDFVSFRSPDDAAAAGYGETQLVSGPRWRMTSNKFGQDLPGLEVPLEPNSQPPYQKDNIKYDTGTAATTVLNLLDWGQDANGDGIVDPSPLKHSDGWMLVDPARLDVDSDGVIDEGWSEVNGTLGAGDAMPTGPIFTAVTPNGLNLAPDFLDAAVYIKGDRQDSAKIYDMQLEIEYVSDLIGTVQKVNNLDQQVRTVEFQQGAMFDSAVVFVTPPTQDGVQPATVRVSNVTETHASIAIEEPDYLTGWHRPEDVSLLTLAEGNWTLEDGSRVEVGKTVLAAGATDTFTSVTFDQAFDEAPTVLVQLQTANGADWAVLRTDNVTATGFDVALQEQEASDGVHDTEVVGWAAIDSANASEMVDWGDVAAQVFSVDRAINHDGFDFTFDPSLGLDPLVNANIASYHGPDTAMLRLESMLNDGTAATAAFKLQEEQSADNEMWHALEDIAGIAFDGPGLLQGIATDPLAVA